MSNESNISSQWQRVKATAQRAVNEAPMVILGVVSLSLLLLLGMVTLGISLMVGVVAILMIKWKQRQMLKDQDNPVDIQVDDKPVEPSV